MFSALLRSWSLPPRRLEVVSALLNIEKVLLRLLLEFVLGVVVGVGRGGVVYAEVVSGVAME